MPATRPAAISSPTMTSSVMLPRPFCSFSSQHFLNFLPLPQGQASLRPAFDVMVRSSLTAEMFILPLIGRAVKPIATANRLR